MSTTNDDSDWGGSGGKQWLRIGNINTLSHGSECPESLFPSRSTDHNSQRFQARVVTPRPG
jgi:hypothetical protein